VGRDPAAGADDELPGAGGVDRALVVGGRGAGRFDHAHVVEDLVVVLVAGEDDVGPGGLEHLPVGVGLGVVGRRADRRPDALVVVLGEEPGAVPHGDDVLVGGGGLLQVTGQPLALGVGGGAARAAAGARIGGAGPVEGDDVPVAEIDRVPAAVVGEDVAAAAVALVHRLQERVPVLPVAGVARAHLLPVVVVAGGGERLVLELAPAVAPGVGLVVDVLVGLQAPVRIGAVAQQRHT